MNTSPRQRGALMATEIAEQPETLSRLLDHGLHSIRAVAEEIRAAAPRFVLLAARGTSDHAALYAKYLIEVGLGLPAGLASPSTLTVYGARPCLDDVLWLSVSQSGGSPDLVTSTTTAGDNGALTVSVTNAPESPLASATRLHVDVLAGPERSVAATKTYTSQLLSLWLLVDAWRGGDGTAARVLPELAAKVLAADDVPDLAPRYRFADRLITTGRGYSYPTAREAALKLMETTYVGAQAFSAADLLHGPFAMVDQDRPVLVFAPQGRAGHAAEPVLERLEQRGADVCLVGDPALAPSGARVVPMPTGVPEELSPVLEIMPAQRLAHAMAVARNIDPDAPRGLAKVTETL
jgi:glucosamine--fructose-6-phosphate aminotransferase (isomerizing)